MKLNENEMLKVSFFDSIVDRHRFDADPDPDDRIIPQV